MHSIAYNLDFFIDQMMRNRCIRVDIAEGDGGMTRRGGGGGNRDEESDRSGGVSNWRSAPSGDDRGDRGN